MLSRSVRLNATLASAPFPELGGSAGALRAGSLLRVSAIGGGFQPLAVDPGRQLRGRCSLDLQVTVTNRGCRVVPVHQDAYLFEVVRLAEITAEGCGCKGRTGAEWVDAMTTSRPGADAPAEMCHARSGRPPPAAAQK